MIKLVLVGVWGCLATVAAGYAASALHEKAHAQSAAPAPPPQESRKTKEMNVPKISNGAITGYVVAQFNYVVDTAALKTLPTPPDPYVVDEAFREIYNNNAMDFQNLKRSTCPI